MEAAVMEINFMAQHGQRLADNGFHILPVVPNGKSPGQFHNGKWHGYPKWQRHCDQPTRTFNLNTWLGWGVPMSIGVACKNVVAVDIDILDADLSQKVGALAQDILGNTPAIRIGKAPKRLLVYRSETSFKTIKRHPVEILGNGAQFVAYGVHPEGFQYHWPVESLADMDFSDLPVITREKVEDFLAAADKIIPDDLKRGTLTKELPSENAQANEDLEGTLEAIEDALNYIDNPDLGYDDWKKIGLALYGALGDDAEQLWHRFSDKSDKNDPLATAREWSGIRRSPPDRIGAGTIYHIAQQAGWVPPFHIHFNPIKEALATAPNPAQGLIDRITADAPPVPGNPQAIAIPFPSRGHEVTGVLRDIRDWIVSTAYRPQPELALAAAIGVVATLAARKVRVSSFRSNVYMIGVAESGGGKNHPKTCCVNLLHAAGLDKHVGGAKIASGQGVLTALRRNPATIFVLDEFGMFLSAALNRDKSPKHITDIIDNLTELYTAGNSVYHGTEYADAEKAEQNKIVNPCPTLYGLTTPVHLWGSLKSANVTDGSLARFLIFRAENDYPDRNIDADDAPPPPGLIEAVQRVANTGTHGEGNLQGVSPNTSVEPLKVELTPEAKQTVRAAEDQIDAKHRANVGTSYNSIVARILENAYRLALIAAVSDNPETPQITAANMEWGLSLANYSAELVISNVEDNVAENETERAVKRVLRIIKDAGPEGCTKTTITRATMSMKRRDRDDIIAGLIEGGLVLMVKVESGQKGRPTYLFRFNAAEN